MSHLKINVTNIQQQQIQRGLETPFQSNINISEHDSASNQVYFNNMVSVSILTLFVLQFYYLFIYVCHNGSSFKNKLFFEKELFYTLKIDNIRGSSNIEIQLLILI